MDTTALKPFAQQMRKDLIGGVRQRMRYWGFAEGEETPTEEVEAIEGGYVFRGEVHGDTSVPAKWKNLRRAAREHTPADVAEEAAYTWFNRLIALRVLEENGYAMDVLAFAPGTEEPALLHNAKQGIFPSGLSENDRERIRELLLSGEEDEAFRRLLVAYCNGHDLLSEVFGRVGDYTQLLLPTGLIGPDGLVRRLVTTGAITTGDYAQVELIGWLYQFYISEKKDAVYAAKGKFRPEDIPAATQIFTPHWIVRYLVENALGRLWLDKYPESPLRDEMEYLVEPESSDDSPEPQEPLFDDLTDLTLFDPAAGSGHILVVGFDLLMKMYREQGYSSAEAVRSILEHNLCGLEIDRRAAQLARFALLMKAAQHDRRALDRGALYPEVYAMPEPRRFSTGDLRAYLGDDAFDAVGAEVKEALDQIREHGQNVGAALKLDLFDEARRRVAERLRYWDEQSGDAAAGLGFKQELAAALRGYLKPLLLLTATYPAVAMNPPYMGSRQMNGPLKNYVKEHYPKSKRDLFAVFMEVGEARTQQRGRLAMINQQSWMFLSSYEKLRTHVLDTHYIESMLHLGPRTFDEISGEVVQSTAFMLRQTPPDGQPGTYYRLVDESSSHAKRDAFTAREHKYGGTRQRDFARIPGSPVAYWVPNTITQVFRESERLAEIAKPRQGLATSDNKKFLRHWSEISHAQLKLDCDSREEARRALEKWFPYNKGGSYRKWYGNFDFVVNWENDGEEIIAYASSLYKSASRTVKNAKFYFSEGITWSDVSSSNFACRHSPGGFIFDVQGSSAFPDKENLFFIMAYLNSIIAAYALYVLNPTMHYQIGNIKDLPIESPNPTVKNKIELRAKQSVSLSRRDWDSRETSWDFAQHPLAAQEASTLEAAYQSWKQQATQDFFQLHTNEEELNRLFIDLYGLEEELSPRVALDDITILEDELDRDALEELDTERDDLSGDELREQLPFLVEVPIRQLLSYGIGVMLGRYRLGQDGLHIAHPEPSAEERAPYDVPIPLAAPEPAGRETFAIDDDAILPLMGAGTPFSDDAVHQMREIVRLLWGEDTLTENLNFINRALSEGASQGYVNPREQTMEGWLVDEFWDYHKSLYSVPYYGKKPIYWLFASPEGHFQVLVYMHRMNKYTVQQVRQNYLHTWQQHLRGQIDELEVKGEETLSNEGAVRLETLREKARDARQYDAILKEVADGQIEIDLDDGVQENYPLFEGAVAPL